jgi:hypothetical protein
VHTHYLFITPHSCICRYAAGNLSSLATSTLELELELAQAAAAGIATAREQLELPQAMEKAAAMQAELVALQEVSGRVVCNTLAVCHLLKPLFHDLELSRRLGPSAVYKLAAACGALLGHGAQILGSMKEFLAVPLCPDEMRHVATVLLNEVCL